MKVKDLLTDESKWYHPGDREAGDLNCIATAIYSAYGSTSSDAILKRVAAKVGGKTAKDIQRWNDAPERTFADVRQLIEELDI